MADPQISSRAIGSTEGGELEAAIAEPLRPPLGRRQIVALVAVALFVLL